MYVWFYKLVTRINKPSRSKDSQTSYKVERGVIPSPLRGKNGHSFHVRNDFSHAEQESQSGADPGVVRVVRLNPVKRNENVKSTSGF